MNELRMSKGLISVVKNGQLLKVGNHMVQIKERIGKLIEDSGHLRYCNNSRTI